MAEARHHHPDTGERHQIYALLQRGRLLRAIERQLKRSVSTISRELKRNSGEDGSYAPDQIAGWRLEWEEIWRPPVFVEISALQDCKTWGLLSLRL